MRESLSFSGPRTDSRKSSDASLNFLQGHR
jgi:hypothetical protein